MTVNSVFIKPAMAKGHLFIHHPKVIVNHSPGYWFITIVAMDNLSSLISRCFSHDHLHLSHARHGQAAYPLAQLLITTRASGLTTPGFKDGAPIKMKSLG